MHLLATFIAFRGLQAQPSCENCPVGRMTRGCPFGTIGDEIAKNDELIRQDLSLIFEFAEVDGGPCLAEVLSQ
jgi:hypothetical protein